MRAAFIAAVYILSVQHVQCKDALAKTAVSKGGPNSGERETQKSDNRGRQTSQSTSTLEVMGSQHTHTHTYHYIISTSDMDTQNLS